MPSTGINIFLTLLPSGWHFCLVAEVKDLSKRLFIQALKSDGWRLDLSSVVYELCDLEQVIYLTEPQHLYHKMRIQFKKAVVWLKWCIDEP